MWVECFPLLIALLLKGKFDNHSMITLTKIQNNILRESLQILKTSNRLVITGKAGTGKTTLVKFLIQELKKDNLHRFKYSVCSAPTNKAVKVLRDKIGMDFDRNRFCTIHSALRLKRDIDPASGVVSFKPDPYNNSIPLEKVSLLIIDEASMVNKEILSYIEKNTKDIKVIFIGDEGQLPPVGELFSPVFHAEYPILELTEIIRQAEDNPIIDLSRNLSYIRNRVSNRTDIGGYIFSNDFGSVISTLAAINGSDKLKYLAWTNQDIDYVNKKVREAIYGTPAKIEIGESLIFNTPYKDFFTNDEVEVHKLSIEEGTFTAYKKHNPYYSVDNFNTPQYLENTRKLKYYVVNDNIRILHESSEGMFTDMKKDMRKKCIEKLVNWRDFYEFVEQFADVKYNHAISIHKSQGSTYNQVIINIKNCMLNKDIDEREKLLYTAITRAKELVILYNT